MSDTEPPVDPPPDNPPPDPVRLPCPVTGIDHDWQPRIFRNRVTVACADCKLIDVNHEV